MIIVNQSAELVSVSGGLDTIKQAGQTCYQSDSNKSDSEFTEMLIRNKHHAMLEFGWAMVRLVTDRGISHELVRHRLFSFAQESTRYCNYASGKFNSE
ncbi:unnamed protein product, partial [marine sediment metagenome]